MSSFKDGKFFNIIPSLFFLCEILMDNPISFNNVQVFNICMNSVLQMFFSFIKNGRNENVSM